MAPRPVSAVLFCFADVMTAPGAVVTLERTTEPEVAVGVASMAARAEAGTRYVCTSVGRDWNQAGTPVPAANSWMDVSNTRMV